MTELSKSYKNTVTYLQFTVLLILKLDFTTISLAFTHITWILWTNLAHSAEENVFVEMVKVIIDAVGVMC